MEKLEPIVFSVTLDCEVKSKKNGKVARINKAGRFLGLMERSDVRQSQANVEDRIRNKLSQDHKQTEDQPLFHRELSVELWVQIDRDKGLTFVTPYPIIL